MFTNRTAGMPGNASQAVLLGLLFLGSSALYSAEGIEESEPDTQPLLAAEPDNCASSWLCSPEGFSWGEATSPSFYPNNLRVTTEFGYGSAGLDGFSSTGPASRSPVMGDETYWGTDAAPLFQSENDSVIYRLSQMENLSLMTFWEKDDAALTLGITRDGLAGISFGPKGSGTKRDRADDPPPTPGEALNFVTGESSGLGFDDGP